MMLPDCRACGAYCCHPDDPDWVEVYEADLAGGLPHHLTRPNTADFAPLPRPPHVMRQEPDGRCVALRGAVGRHAACEVYDVRPGACRALKRGSPSCLWMLGRHGLGRGW